MWQLIEIMNRTHEPWKPLWKQAEGRKPFYDNAYEDRILWAAAELGLVFRKSISQVQWTKKGLAEIDKDLTMCKLGL